MCHPGFEDQSLASPETVSGFKPIVEALAEESANFTGPVYLVNGDSHQFNEDAPLAAESPWLDVYFIDPVPNLQRMTAEGAATSREWLRVSVAPNSAQGVDVLSWERVPFSE